MKLSELSVKNPLIVNAVSLFFLVSGGLALLRIERESFPNFSYDIVTVRTNYPGAPPEVIEKRITMPLEKELRDVEDLKEIGSVSLEGLSLLIVKIDPDAPDKKQILNDIQKAVDQAKDLPDDLEESPRVREIQSRNTPLVEVSLSGDLPEAFMREIAKNLETEILDLPGVGSVARKGMRDKEIWVEIDPEKMGSNQIALQDIILALAERNINVAGGLHKEGNREWILRTSGELMNKEDVASVIIRANEEGHWIQVRDVAKTTNQFEETQVLQRTDQTRAINLLVIKKDSSDAIRLKDDLVNLVDNFKAKNSPKLKIAFVNDVSYYIKRRLKVLVSNGWIGTLLVLIPMVIFLSPRVAVATLFGMGVALLASLTTMSFLGMSINLISMFGLIMVLGMLVDEELVVADNVARYLEMGLPHREAAIRGASEVGRAILSTVLTTIIAFVPLLFMSGIFGKFLRDIPKVVIITLTASLLQALFILPSHLSDLNRPNREGKNSMWEKKRQHDLFDRIKNFYKRTLKHTLHHPGVTVTLSFIIAGALILYGIFGMKFVLFPARGIEAFFIRAEAKIGTPLETTEKMMSVLEEMVSTLPQNELEHMVTQVGIMQNDPGDPFTTRGSHIAQIEVYLTPPRQRTRNAEEIMTSLREKLPPENGFEKVHFDPVKPGPPVGKPIAIRFRGDNFETLQKMADLTKKEITNLKGVNDIRDDYEEGKGELRVIVDEWVATQAGLGLRDIAKTVRYAFEGAKATTLKHSDDDTDVIVRLPEKSRHDLKSISSLLIRTPAGNLIPLNRLARLEEFPGVGAIKHFDGKRAITVTANIQEKLTTSVTVNEIVKTKLGPILVDYPEISVHYGGEAEDTRESLLTLYHAFIAAILLICLILLVTFESITQTLVIMLSIPFGAVGVVIGFAIAGEPFSFLALLGMVGLTGIVVDGGTLIFVFINRMKKEAKEGLPLLLEETIIEGCTVRLRSILLTTITTVLGVIPAAYGIGGSDPFIRPMALALNWGLAVSIFFTLYTLPSLYYLAEKTRVRIQERFGTFSHKKG